MSRARLPGTRKRDETIKKRLYERFAVSEHWVADPELDMIKVYRRSEERYVRVAELSLENKDVLTTFFERQSRFDLTARHAAQVIDINDADREFLRIGLAQKEKDRQKERRSGDSCPGECDRAACQGSC